MGGVVKKIKKTVKKVTKPITKIVKKTVKKVKKIGKAVMKGVSKISNKLGPVGMIALSIAMPYALTGLSNFTNFAQAYSGVGQTFLNAVGTVGNQIRLGYRAFNTAMSAGKKSITDIIGKTFEKFAPKGGTNIFSRISDGAKRLYTAAKEKLKSVSPKFGKAKEGMSEVFGTGYSTDGPMLMSNTDLASKMTLPITDPNYISAGQVNMKSLTESGGWFTRTNAAGVQADTIVSDVINDAYKTRLDGFGTNAKRMFTDIKNKALEMDTYINDEQIGSFVENSKAATSYRTENVLNYTGSASDVNRFQIKTEIPDLGATGDYKLFNPNEPNSYVFNGNETFGKQPATKNFLQKNAKKLKDLTKSILAPKGDTPIEQAALPLNLDTSKVDMSMSTYEGTDQQASQGGSLVAAVYGQDSANMLKYVHNMNLLNSGDTYKTSIG
jgi:hypothetical protein